MAREALINSPCGSLVPIEGGLKAFVPNPLPRRLNLAPKLVYKLDEASRAVATLAGVGETIPNPHLLIHPFLRREAVLSSKIEGTQASISDIFRFEASGERRATGDVIEVANYIRALENGRGLLKHLSICVRLMNEIHGQLLKGVRGHDKRPGELRDRQVWIGSENTLIADARFIPPSANHVRDLLLDLERFVNEPPELPPLIQCALMHYQIEAIHPYVDGNGRIGRLLVILFLCSKEVLPTPLLYLSAYFERDKAKYYDELLAMSETGNWERWLTYFLEGLADQAKDSLLRARTVRMLAAQTRKRLQAQRESGATLRIADELFAQPFITAPKASKLLGITNQGARNILDRLTKDGILENVPGSWPRLYVAKELLRVIEAPTGAG